jgi:tRNA-splicing ligase RtcB (3'-phosphate/5'-hydroxy nucleic acid ligase)
MPAPLNIFGRELINDNAIEQMTAACQLPCAVAGALMPDAHLGYGLPIGGVLALDNCVSPYAVGVDIACRMKLSIFDVSVAEFQRDIQNFCWALEFGTRFGVGVENGKQYDNPVLYEDWGISPITRAMKDKARAQLGTSGSGNHFVEFGLYTPIQDDNLVMSQQRVALLSHSGSRGTGAQVCNYYNKLAKDQCKNAYGDLNYLRLDSAEGQEYWAAMNLMGRYAKANHDTIHAEIANLIGGGVMNQIENHHNFAWTEKHQGKHVVVHRKGATPAGSNSLGIIPGSMGTPAYIVKGTNNKNSLASASHGAGRVMSRREAKGIYKDIYTQEIAKLAEQGITVLSASADELVGVYKDIEAVMAVQVNANLIQRVAKFEPKIVKMCADGSKAED